jgi:hypothetical protein
MSDNDPMLMVHTIFLTKTKQTYVILLLPFSVTSTVGNQTTGMPIVVLTNIAVVVDIQLNKSARNNVYMSQSFSYYIHFRSIVF